VETFLKISIKCKKKFVVLHPTESAPFIDELLSDLAQIITDLEPQHIHIFYEAVGHVISVADKQRKEPLIKKFMSLPNARVSPQAPIFSHLFFETNSDCWMTGKRQNQQWSEIVTLAAQNVENLKNPVILKDLVNLLKTNSRAASSLRSAFMFQMRVIYRDMLEVYKAYSTMITQEVVEKGEILSHTQNKSDWTRFC